jgi:hypothetical protein
MSEFVTNIKFSIVFVENLLVVSKSSINVCFFEKINNIHTTNLLIWLNNYFFQNSIYHVYCIPLNLG